MELEQGFTLRSSHRGLLVLHVSFLLAGEKLHDGFKSDFFDPTEMDSGAICT